jgi:ketosteroid isomerase-like protein
MNVFLMFRFTFLVTYLIGTSPIVFGQAATTSPVLAAEVARFEAMITADTAALREMLHPDLLYIHSNGLEESANDLMSSVAARDIIYQSFEPQQAPRVQVFGETALADGLVRVSGRYRGDAFAMDLRYTSVYREVRSRWLLIRWQSLKAGG